MGRQAGTSEFRRARPRRQRGAGYFCIGGLLTHDTRARRPDVGGLHHRHPHRLLCRLGDIPRQAQRTDGISRWIGRRTGRPRHTKSEFLRTFPPGDHPSTYSGPGTNLFPTSPLGVPSRRPLRGIKQEKETHMLDYFVTRDRGSEEGLYIGRTASLANLRI